MSEAKALKGVQIFTAGLHRGKEYTDDDLRDIVRNFEQFSAPDAPKVYLRVPAVLGHDEEQELLQRSDLPAAGWPDRVYRDGEFLFADFPALNPRIARLIESGAFRTVSAEIYDEPPEGIPGARGKMLRRIAFLGGDIPEVKGLNSLDECLVAAHSESAAREPFAPAARRAARSLRPGRAVRLPGEGAPCYAVFSEVRRVAKPAPKLGKRMAEGPGSRWFGDGAPVDRSRTPHRLAQTNARDANGRLLDVTDEIEAADGDFRYDGNASPPDDDFDEVHPVTDTETMDAPAPADADREALLEKLAKKGVDTSALEGVSEAALAEMCRVLDAAPGQEPEQPAPVPPMADAPPEGETPPEMPEEEPTGDRFDEEEDADDRAEQRLKDTARQYKMSGHRMRTDAELKAGGGVPRDPQNLDALTALEGDALAGKKMAEDGEDDDEENRAMELQWPKPEKGESRDAYAERACKYFDTQEYDVSETGEDDEDEEEKAEGEKLAEEDDEGFDYEAPARKARDEGRAPVVPASRNPGSMMRNKQEITQADPSERHYTLQMPRGGVSPGTRNSEKPAKKPHAYSEADFDARVAAAVGKELDARKGELRRFSEEQAASAKKSAVDAVIDRLGLEGRLAPAEREEVRDQLARADSRSVVRKFSEADGRRVELTEFDLQVRALERRPTLFAERFRQPAGSQGGEDAEVAKVEAHFEAYSERFDAIGTKKEEIVGAFKAKRKRDPKLTAEQFLNT